MPFSQVTNPKMKNKELMMTIGIKKFDFLELVEVVDFAFIFSLFILADKTSDKYG